MSLTLGSSRLAFNPNSSINRLISGISSLSSRGSRSRKAFQPLLHSNHISRGFPRIRSVLADDGKHIWEVREVSDSEDSDIMIKTPWRWTIGSLMGLTALFQVWLGVWSTRLQFRTLLDRRTSLDISDGYMLWATFLLILELLPLLLWYLPISLLKLNLFFNDRRKRLRLIGDHVPAVDILITSCKEEVSVVQDTILAALSIDYPQDKFRILLADDGGSEELRYWVSNLKQTKPNLHYTSRKTRGGFKAGNLNHAFQYLEDLGGAHKFIASLDADMIVEKRWLRSVMAHMVLDDELALACPSQHFYNLPVNDPLYQANRPSWHGQDFIRDSIGLAWNTGSGYVLRRDALEQIGGFPTESLTEDVLSSMKMLRMGWKTAYIPEALQYGLVPSSLIAHIKQFVRWNVGGTQLACFFRFYLSKQRTQHLNRSQRFLCFSYAFLTIVLPTVLALNLIFTAIRLATGTPLIYFSDFENMRLLLRIQCAGVVFKWLSEFHASSLTGYHAAIQECSFGTWMAPYCSITFFRLMILPSWLGGTTSPGFTPTGSLSDTLHERSPRKRAPLTRRAYHLLYECGLWFHVAIIIALASAAWFRAQAVFTEFGIANGWNRNQGWNQGWNQELISELLRYVLWPSPNWLICIFSMLVPVQYALFPPSVPDRDELLGSRNEDGARYPLPKHKDTRRTWYEVEYTQLYSLLVLVNAVVFISTWYM